MQPVKNERGAVLVFVTLMIVLLLIMVGMGLDTGHLVYIRAQGQPAVDAAALAAAAAIPAGNVSEAVKAFSPSITGVGKNDYMDSSNNLIDSANVTFVQYN